MSEQKGVPRKKSGIVKLASPEVIAAVRLPVPLGQLEAVAQSFDGISGIPPTPKITGSKITASKIKTETRPKQLDN